MRRIERDQGRAAFPESPADARSPAVEAVARTRRDVEQSLSLSKSRRRNDAGTGVQPKRASREDIAGLADDAARELGARVGRLAVQRHKIGPMLRLGAQQRTEGRECGRLTHVVPPVGSWPYKYYVYHCNSILLWMQVGK